MKNILQATLFVFGIFILQNAKAQDTIINIPDANFKAKLLQADTSNGVAKDSLDNSIKIDVNNDGEIQQSEANRVYILMNIADSNIATLEGINSFINLVGIGIFSTSLAHLDIRLPNLLEFGCNYCNLTNIDLSGMPKLEYLSLAYNQLSSLDLSVNPNLELLYLDNNLLNTLDLKANTKLYELFCDNNQLTSLDISMIPNLDILFCSNNQITSLFLKNNKMNYDTTSNIYYDFGGNLDLKYICADEFEIGVLKQKMDFFGYTDVIINSFCSSSAAGSFYNLNVASRYDASNNGCTAQDSLFPNLKYKISNATDSGYAISDAKGNMSINLEAGTYTYTIQPIFTHPYFTISPSQATVTLPEDTLSTQFCILPIATINDVSVTIIPTVAARPGFSDATYEIVYTNKGTTTVGGTIEFTFQDSLQDYQSSTEVPTSNSNGVLTFEYSNLKSFESRSIFVTLRTNAPTDEPAVNGGDVLTLSATINMTNTPNQNADDDTSIIRQTVVNSFDPNDKRCLEGDIVTPDLVGDFVNYLIRFENEGTASAVNIVVTDRIDTTKFDVSTLEITSTSHSSRTLISEGNKVQFIFDNIQLPHTEPDKHGYVAFKIKTKSNLVIGDSLKNFADIYFDYNLPITTNTVGSRIDTFARTGGVTSIKSNTNKEGKLSIYPNPSNGNFKIDFVSKGNFPIAIKLIDLNGRVIKQIEQSHDERSTLDISENQLSNGLYQISIQTGKDIWQQKLMIVK